MDQFNEHNKDEYPPMHTAEHIVNGTVDKMFGCGRSKVAHIERRKSKMSFEMERCPTAAEVDEIMSRVNAVVDADVPVTYDVENAEGVEEGISLERLPDDVSRKIRIVRVGDYDKCACIGKHVEHTGQIGRVVLLGTNWDEERRLFRLRFKLEGTTWE